MADTPIERGRGVQIGHHAVDLQMTVTPILASCFLHGDHAGDECPECKAKRCAAAQEPPADEVLDGYERDLEDLKAKLHAKHDRVAALETALRWELWINHGCPTVALYGDDGEMSCGNCAWDFKRRDVLDTIEHVKGARLKRAAALAAAQEPPAEEEEES